MLEEILFVFNDKIYKRNYTPSMKLRNRICTILRLGHLIYFSVLTIFCFGQYVFKAQKVQFGNGLFPDQTENSESDRNIYITPFAGPAYSPDAGFILAGGTLISFKTNPSDSLIQRSSLPISFNYTTRGSTNLYASLNSYWLQDKFRLNASFYLKNAKDDYWGVGYEAGFALPQSDSTTVYRYKGFQIKPKAYFQIRPKLFVGGILDFNKTNVTETNAIMEEDPAFVQFGPKNYNAGIGGAFLYDTRDIATNAWKGIYANISYTNYGGFLGGDNNYQLVEFDFRLYRMIERPGNTVAFLFKGRFGIGDVPYAELSKLGGSSNLRGYIESQFRDQSGIILLGEYRHTFKKEDGTLGKGGIVFWAGTGTITNRLETTRQWLNNLGFGYRYEVQPRANVRIDLGIGRETSGVYFSFNEAF